MSYAISDFLQIRTAAPTSFSADGSKISISSNLSGTMQLYRTDPSGGQLVPITSFDEPVSGGYLPMSDRLLIQMDEGGNERSQLYLINDDGSGFEKVVYDPDYIHEAGGVSRDEQTIAYSCNRRNGVDFDIWIHSLKTGDERCVFNMGGYAFASGFSPDARFLSVVRESERNGDNDMYLVDLETDDVIHVTPHDEEASYSAPSWLPDSSAFFFSTDEGREFASIARYDVMDASWKYVIETEWNATCTVDHAGKHLLVNSNVEGYSQFDLYNPKTLKLKHTVPFESKGVALPVFSKDGRYLAYYLISPIEPGDAWLYDTQAKETSRLSISPNPIPPTEFVEPELHRFDSFDGESIPAFLFLPEGSGPHPAVAFIHGGPESQFRPVFFPIIQFLVHSGYAVVAPNVRGSIGYGKRYHHLDDVRKRLDSVKDLAAMHAWLAKRGDIDPKRIALMGGSYGGYMTLAGLAFQPDLWAAGVDTVGISNLVTFLENTSAYRRKVREREYGSLEKDRDFLLEVSPLTHIDKMKAPLFIIHGTNDPRVPVGEATQIHEALTANGIHSELLIYEDEGHGLAKLKNRLDAYPQVAAFLNRVLAP
ncbi:MAG TPA: S9 family peptidase [Actinomycetota bacterium]|nr:S9 family peptidase [Actinomycetota bacterium]